MFATSILIHVKHVVPVVTRAEVLGRAVQTIFFITDYVISSIMNVLEVVQVATLDIFSATEYVTLKVMIVLIAQTVVSVGMFCRKDSVIIFITSALMVTVFHVRLGI